MTKKLVAAAVLATLTALVDGSSHGIELAFLGWLIALEMAHYFLAGAHRGFVIKAAAVVSLPLILVAALLMLAGG